MPKQKEGLSIEEMLEQSNASVVFPSSTVSNGTVDFPPQQRQLISAAPKEVTTDLMVPKPIDNHIIKQEQQNPFEEICFDIKDPLELLVLLDEDVSKGIIQLHQWQIQFLIDCAKGGQVDTFPFQALVRACNGSGKDKYVIAPCVVWLCMKYYDARGIVTSSSGQQLDTQTDAYINQLCKEANFVFGGIRSKDGPIWKCNYRYYECLISRSPIVLFATDEAGKAEGYHPLKAGRKMGIFESEAKSVPDEINTALSRCTGYTHRVLVSTPGTMLGHFYEYCTTAVKRKTIKSVLDVSPIDWIEYHVTAYDCSHISRNYIEQQRRDLPGHENGSAFKSMIMAEFGSTDEMVVIPNIYIHNCCKEIIPWRKVQFNTGGLDLSDGGDETALTVRNGNRHLITIPFKFDNTEDTVEYLNGLFKDWNLDHPETLIYSDMGGLGKPILDRMKRQGWSNIRYVDNRRASTRPKTYKNYGTEMWFHTRLLMERTEIIVVNEAVLFKQLCGRYYKMVEGGACHQLLSKVEQRARGYHSPDRADSFVLCFSEYKSTYIEKDEKPFTIDEVEEKKRFEVPHDFDLKSWATEQQKPVIQHLDADDLKEEIKQYNRNLVSK